MTGRRRLLFVFGCVCCLLVVASALPAADPRIPSPGGDDGEPRAGEWDAIDGTPTFDTDPPDDADREDVDDDHEVGADIHIDGAIEPGNEVRIDVDSVGHFNERTVEVNGESVGRTEDWGRIDVVVPYAEEMNVSVPEEGISRTVDVETDATIETHDGAAPANEFELSAAVGSTPVEDATVSVDGEAAATTDEDGYATVTLPETAGPADLRVERGPVEGSRTVDVAEPDVEFVSPLLFPGSPAPVQVSADGTGVEGASVSIEDGGSATTDDDGRAFVWLPIDDEATVTAEIGEESATATVGNLYLRLGAVAVLVPGFVIGSVVTYVRLAAARERRRARRRGAVFDGGIVALAGALAGLSDALAGFFAGLSGALANFAGRAATAPGALSGLVDGLRRVGIARLVSMPRSGLGWRLPSIGAAVSSFGSALGSVSALASTGRSSPRSGGSIFDGSPFDGLLGSDEDDGSGEPTDGDSPTLSAEPLAPRGPRAEIRAAWHAFLDRLELENRETLTPGDAGRRALAAGFPADRVARLVSILRDVEYGGRDASAERVAEARRAAADLLDHDPDEEGAT